MRSVARWLLCVLLPLSFLACGQQGRETASVEQDLIGYWRARLKDADGDLFDATWAFKADRSYALWIALLAKDGTPGQSRQMATGTWSVNGRKLVILSETDGKAEVQKFTVSELAEKSVVIKDESDGETATLRRVESAPGDVARAASPQSQAKAQQAQKQESKPTLIAQASEFLPDKQSRYLYFTLKAPGKVSIAASIDGGPISLIHQPDHFTEGDYASLLVRYMEVGMAATMASIGGDSSATDLQKRLARIERQLRGGVLTKIDAFGTYQGDWQTLAAGEYTIVLDNSGEIGTRRGDAAVQVSVYGLQ